MGLLKTAAAVAVASSVHGRVQRRQQQRWAEQDQRAGVPAPAVPHGGYAPPPIAAPGAGSPDLSNQLDLIRQLNELRESGALTDAEFEAKKAQILQT
jgi:transposase-like protein